MAESHGKFAVLIVCLLAVFSAMPLFQPYFFASSDGLFHVFRLMEYHTVLSDGVLYPRWAPDFFFGLGMPLFNFYAPLTYYLGEVFHLLGAGYIDSLRLLAAVAMVFSGVGAYLYARTALSTPAALLVGVAYQYVPYHLVNLYFRGDLPEYLAYTWFPFILWAMSRLIERKRLRDWWAGTLFYAALILTHNLSAFIFSGFLVVYGSARLLRRWIALRRKSAELPDPTGAVDERPVAARLCGVQQDLSPRGLAGAIWPLLAMALCSWALTAFFWLPALAEKSLVNFDRLLFHYNFHEHFPTVDQLLSGDLLHRYGVVFRGAEVFGYKLGLLQAVFLVAGSSVLLLRFRRLRVAARMEAAVSLLVAALALFLIFPISLAVWDNVPLLSLTQFPWRFLGFVALPSALLAGVIVEAWPGRLRWVVVTALVPVVIFSAVARLSPIMSDFKEADISPLGSLEFELTYGAIGTSAAAEYLPVWVKDVPASSPRAFNEIVGQGGASPAGQVAEGMSAELTRRKANENVYAIRSNRGGDFVPDLLYFPGWNAYLDGNPIGSEIDDPSGMVKVAVPAGDHVLTLRFEETPLRRTGDVLSGVSLLAIIVLSVLIRSRERRKATAQRGERPKEKPAPVVRQHTALANKASVAKVAAVIAVLLAWGMAQAGYDAGVTRAAVGWRPLVANLDDQVMLEGFDLQGLAVGDTSTGRVAGGAQFSAILVWRLLAYDQNKRYKPFVRLTNRHDQTWAYTEASAAYPQAGADRGAQQITTLSVIVPQGTPPGIYQVEAGFVDTDHGRVLEPRSVRISPMLPGERGVRMGTLIVERTPSVLAPVSADADLDQMVNFGDALRLLDVALSDGEALRSGRQGKPLTKDSNDLWTIAAGQPVHLDLLWQALGKLNDNLTITARLAGADGLLYAVHDSQPADGTYPTSLWTAGEVARDQLNLVVGPETPAGRYELQIEVISRAGPLSIFDLNHAPVGPTFRVGKLAVLPSPTPGAAPTVKMQHSVDMAVSEGLTLVGYTLGRSELRPGDQLRVDLLWRATKLLGGDLNVMVAVVDGQGKAWSTMQLKVGGKSYPTSEWRVGELVRQQTELTLPGGAPSGAAKLAITVVDPAGRALGTTELGSLRVLSRERTFAAAPSRPADKVLDGKMRLLGFDVAAPVGQADGAVVVAAGQPLAIRLYWQGLAEMGTNYTVFTQVLNASGKLVAQHDAPPAGGLAPTVGWIKDEVVVDGHLIDLPAGLPIGRYSLIAGVYDSLTGKRLPIAGDGDVVVLTAIDLVTAK